MVILLQWEWVLLPAVWFKGFCLKYCHLSRLPDLMSVLVIEGELHRG
jgi:hypothetical protein